MSLIDKLAQLRAEIATHAPGRDVKLIAVTKHATPQQMADAYDAGLTDFGENKWQDADDHMAAFHALRPQAKVNWHFIGHLQSNKASKITGRFALVHSVDSTDLARRISVAATAQNLTQDILLQVNISAEASKSGFSPVETQAALTAIKTMTGVAVKGLMTMAPLSDDSQTAESVFSQLFQLRDQLQGACGISLPELSMGMTKDYVPALRNGATIIRIGTLLFK